MMTWGGFHVVLNPSMVVPDGEDWSRVRSPGRARRRRKKHRQNIRVKYKPDTKIFQYDGRMMMHPAIWEELKRSGA